MTTKKADTRTNSIPAMGIPTPAVIDRRRDQEEAQRDMAIEASLQRARGWLLHDDPLSVNTGDHLKGYQELRPAMKLLPSHLTREVSRKWEQLAVELLDNRAEPKNAGWSKREKIRALYAEVAEIFEQMRRANHGDSGAAAA